MRSLFRSLRFLYTLALSPRGLIQSRNISIGDTVLPADFYPASHSPGPAVVFCPGLTPHGKDEPRVRKVACALRASGYSVLVPSFPAAQKLQIDPEMIDHTAAAFHALLDFPECDAQRCGIIGVSVGGTFALRAATQSPIRQHVAWIMTIGAYASLANVLAYAFDGVYPKGGLPFDPPPDPYVRDIFLENFSDYRLQDGIDRFIEEKKSFIDLISLRSPEDLPTPAAMLITHSPSDSIVPWPEMNTITSLFRKKKVPCRTELLHLHDHAEIPSLRHQWKLLVTIRGLMKMQHIRIPIAPRVTDPIFGFEIS